MEQDRECQLYRHYNGDTLLYVGISLSAIGRLQQHNQASWVKTITRVTIEQFPSRAEALKAELLAIATEQPLHNKAGKQKLSVPSDTTLLDLTSAQLRAARKMLNWSGKRLAEASGVSLPTIRRSEPIEGPLRMMPANARAIRFTLETAGVEFIGENGVQLRCPSPQR